MAATWTRLPPEIIAEIGQHILPFDLLSFALTCRASFQSTTIRLQHNKQLQQDIRVVHDRQPTTIPRLLRLVLADNDAAWHVRALELWVSRPGFSFWKNVHNWDAPESISDWPESNEDHSMLTSDFYTHDECDRYAEQMRSLLQLPEENTDGWITHLLSGWDDPLKVMLLANLPRLQWLNCIGYTIRTDEIFVDGSPLDRFADAIASVQASLPAHGIWPIGFQSLRVINVCSQSRWLSPMYAFYTTPSTVACLFGLPNLQTLNLRCMIFRGGDVGPDYDLQARSSSIQDLSLDSCYIRLDDYAQFLRAPRRLRKFRWRAVHHGAMFNDEYDSKVLKILSEYHRQYLEVLSIDYCLPIDYDRLAQDLPNLKIIDNVSVLSDLWSHDLTQILPTSLEALFMRIEGDHYPEELNLKADTIRSLLSNVIRLIENKRHTRLHSICLRELSEAVVYEQTDDGQEVMVLLRSKDWFLDMMHQIEAAGIDTHRDAATGSGKILAKDEHTIIHKLIWPTLQILTEPRPLTEEEFGQLKSSPWRSARWLMETPVKLDEKVVLNA